MQHSEDMYILMAKILGNEATLTEKVSFKTWLMASSENQSIWEDAQFVWRKRRETSASTSSFDSKKAWQKLMRLGKV
jgi:ferric-dicitrate binding protein FerR (iron transport regulator)